MHAQNSKLMLNVCMLRELLCAQCMHTQGATMHSMHAYSGSYYELNVCILRIRSSYSMHICSESYYELHACSESYYELYICSESYYELHACSESYYDLYACSESYYELHAYSESYYELYA